MFDDNQVSIVYSKAPLLIRLGFLSVDRQHIPKFCGFFSFIIANLQTIALLLNNSRLFLPKQIDGIDSIVKGYLKIFGFAEFFTYTNRISVFIWAGIMLIYCLHFATLLLYLSIKLKKQQKIPDFLKKYWSVMNFFHPLVIFYPIHTFNLRVLQGCKNSTFTNPISMPEIILFYANIVINFLLAFLSTRFFHVVIKTKDPLSCKNNHIRTGDLISKTVAPIIWVFASDNSFMQVSTIITGFIDCLRRDFALFYYLPYYSTEILQLSALMQGATTALATAALAAKIMSYSTMDLHVHFLWIILTPLLSKLYSSLLRIIFRYIISAKSSSLNLHYAVHKRYLLRYLLKIRTPPNSETRIFNLHYFIFRSILSQSIESSQINPNTATVDSLQDIRAFYSDLISRYPKSHVAKVTLASHYVKKENAYLLANNLIEEVAKNSPGFSVRISLCLIRFELQKKTFQQYSQQGEQNLNVLHYVQTTTLNAQLKKQIKHQIRKQLEFWANFVSGKPDMGVLTGLALKVAQEKKDIQKTWKELNKIRPSTFFSSPLLYGMYASFVNNDAGDGKKFMEQYHNDILNSSKLLEVDELNNDTIMAAETARITMSGSRTKIGYILDCSSNITEVYGWKKEFLTKQPIITIMPPYYQQKHDKFLLNHFNTGKIKLLNNTSLLPVMGSDGYIRPSRVHIKMHPFVEHGISYVSILRTIQESKRMLLIRKDGTIDAMSRNFASDMGLLSKKKSFKPLDIFTVCPGFREVNSTFNKKAIAIIHENSIDISSIKKETSLSDTGATPSSLWFRNERSASQKSSIELFDTQAQRTYGLFTKGSKLAFYPETGDPIFYNVQIVTRIHGKDFIKVLSLEPITNKEDEAIINNLQTETPFFPQIENKNQQDRPPILSSDRISSSRPLMVNSLEKLPIPLKIDELDDISVANITIPEEFEEDKDDNENKEPPVRILLNNRQPPSKIRQEKSSSPSPQEQNFLRKKVQKLREKEFHHHHQEGSLTGSTLSRGKKAQNLVTKALDTTTYKAPAILFCISFLIFNLITVSLQSSQCLSVVQLIDDIKSKTNVMSNGAFRLTSLISLGMYARSWLQVSDEDGDGDGDRDITLTIASMYSIFTQDASRYNKILREQVSEIDPKYQMQFYVENIRMYETGAFIGLYSNFDAAGLLIDHSMRFVNDLISSNYTMNGSDHVRFVLDNLFDDFLQASFSATELILDDVNDTINSATTKTTLLYIFVVLGTLGFFLIALMYFYHHKNSSKRFAFLLFRLNLQEIQQLQAILQQFIRSLDAGNVHNLEEINEQYDPQEAVKKPSTTTHKDNFQKPSMSNLTKRQVLVFLKLLPVFIAAIIGTLIYYLSTRGILSQVDQQQQQIQSSLTKIVLESVLITQFIEFIITNGTLRIGGVPVEMRFLYGLDNLRNVNQFIDGFRDSNGELSSEEQAVFFSFPCSDFANYGLEFPDLLVSFCRELSYGQETTSFTTLNAQLYTSLTRYYTQFIASNRTSQDIEQVFDEGSDQFFALALVTPAMCTILYRTNLQDFENQTDSARRNQIMFLIETIVGTWVGAIFAWFFMIKKILALESYHKTILKIVPIRLILANQHLKQYVIMNSNHILDSVTSLL